MKFGMTSQLLLGQAAEFIFSDGNLKRLGKTILFVLQALTHDEDRIQRISAER